MVPAPCACTSLRKAARAVTRFYDEALAGEGLTAGQFSILRAIERRGTAPLSGLAHELVMDRTSIYRALQPLLRQDLVRTRACRVDRRVKEATLTGAGRRRIGAILPRWRRAQRAFLERYGRESWLELAAGLDRVVEDAAGLSATEAGVPFQ